jgi:hypothetical protein
MTSLRGFPCKCRSERNELCCLPAATSSDLTFHLCFRYMPHWIGRLKLKIHSLKNVASALDSINRTTDPNQRCSQAKVDCARALRMRRMMLLLPLNRFASSSCLPRLLILQVIYWWLLYEPYSMLVPASQPVSVN